MSTLKTRVTAGVLLIGDELLSGRTQDLNLQAIAEFLAPLGVQVREARTVGDDQAQIAEALAALRVGCDYVITTGGIGPTHDDITIDAIAAALGVEVEERADVLALLEARYAARGEILTPARRRMARAPKGARPIANPVTGAPGFQIENVFILAGVPMIARGMLFDVGPRLVGGAVVESRTVQGPGLREGDLGDALAALQAEAVDVAIGSYPYFRSIDDYGVQIVLRGVDPAALSAATAAVGALLDRVRAQNATRA